MAITRLAQKYIDDYKAAYDRIAGDKGRSYDKIVASADDADEQLMRNLAYGGGETSDLGELDHAMGSKDVDKVKEILRKQPNREAIDKLVAAYNQLGTGRDLRRQLFGVTMKEQTATPEEAQSSEAFAAVGGLVRGREAALIAEQLGKPKTGELSGADAGAAANADWYAKGGATEFSATWANRGATGRLREIGDDPETQRLLERTRDDLAKLKAQFDAEKDPAKRARLVEEMRKLRGTLTGDAAAYEKDNERVLGEIRSALSFAVSIALAIAIPGAGAGIVAFLQTTAHQHRRQRGHQLRHQGWRLRARRPQDGRARRRPRRGRRQVRRGADGPGRRRGPQAGRRDNRRGRRPAGPGERADQGGRLDRRRRGEGRSSRPRSSRSARRAGRPHRDRRRGDRPRSRPTR